MSGSAPKSKSSRSVAHVFGNAEAFAPPKERPIPFTAAEVRAVLDGRKRQFRRVVKKAADHGAAAEAVYPDGSGKGWIAWWGQGPFSAERTLRAYPGNEGFPCPYGAPGDRLWVRETFIVECIDAGGHDHRDCRKVHYAADGPHGLVRGDTDLDDDRPAPWRSPIFLPRWASRILLAVESVRVERLHAITEEDARAEGVDEIAPEVTTSHTPTARERFEGAWHEINGAESWHENPWVWVVGFRVAERAA